MLHRVFDNDTARKQLIMAFKFGGTAYQLTKLMGMRTSQCSLKNVLHISQKERIYRLCRFVDETVLKDGVFCSLSSHARAWKH